MKRTTLTMTLRMVTCAIAVTLSAGCSKPDAGAKAESQAAAQPAAQPADKAAKPADKVAKPAEKAATGTPKPPASPSTGAPSTDAYKAPADVAAAPADAQKTKSGLASKVLKPGTGAKRPNPWDKVTVHYTGWTTDGKMFDSSRKRGKPIDFPLNGVIAGWTEGVGLMVEGEQRRLWIPQNLAYKGRPGAPAGMLVFDVELLKITPGIKPPPAPADVAAAPKDAEVTKSGLASKVLVKGIGTVKPKPTDKVEVHYTGWTTDGKMFDSSVVRDKPAAFPLTRVIPGWTEGVALMVEGEKRRLWIPEALAYKGRPGAPAGMLVFDVELLKILK